MNQSPVLAGVDLLALDIPLAEAVAREGGRAMLGELEALGRWAGSVEALELGRLANEMPPRLKTHDAKGNRIDRVEFHPAYHELMRRSIAAGLGGRIWRHEVTGEPPAEGRHVVRAAGLYLMAEVETGHCCPVTMTNAAVPALLHAPDLARLWLPRIVAGRYDPELAPPALKEGVTLGMAMTERQGGTDVRANTTRASPDGGDGLFRIDGHKWFMSAPMSDAFLVLAQAPAGISCLLVPRVLADGSLNGIRLERLKDKLGNRSNASSEASFVDAAGWLVGEEGRGVRTIMEMVTETRLDCAIASTALMRAALAEAVHHARHRSVFGERLINQPLMRQVLADLALDVEAAVALVFRLARAFDHVGDPRAAAWRRLMTPVAKFWVCKIAPAFLAEAMECLGGNGYIEESRLPRLYREAPVNSIWEGSGNVMALDVLRVLQREPDVAAGVLDELEEGAAGDAYLKAGVASVRAVLQSPRDLDVRARALVEGFAVVTAAALLRAHAPQAVADGFIASRLTGLTRQTYGQGLDWLDTRALIERALPTG